MALSYEALEILKEQLIQMEGYRQFPYRDIQQKLTIGIGRNLNDVGISLDESITLLCNDIEEATSLLEKLPFFNDLEDIRKIVLINMCFNMGYAKLMQFKGMIAALEKKDYEGASKEMLSSLWAKQVPGRVKTLARMMVYNSAF